MSGYFSEAECAGGCGNLLPANLVAAGRKYLWGHKQGCPPEGERARKKKPGVQMVRTTATAKAGPVVHTSYERTLAMTTENLQAVEAEVISAQATRDAADARLDEALRKRGVVRHLLGALMAVVPASCDEYGRAAKVLGHVGVAEDVQAREGEA